LATHYKIRDLILEFKDTRIKQNLTQAEIAEKMGTKQTAVSRFESYETKPTIAFLMKYAKALGKDMVIQLESDFLIEVPQQAREKALQLKAEVNMDIKEFFTEVLVDFVSQRYEPLMSVNSIDALEFTSEKVIEFAGLQTEAV